MPYPTPTTAPALQPPPTARSNATWQATLRAAQTPADPRYRAAWGAIVDHHYPYVVSVARALLRARRDVEVLDVAQEVFARACGAIGRFVPTDPSQVDTCLRGWFASITRRFVLDELRRPQEARASDALDEPCEAVGEARHIEQSALCREVVGLLRRELERCPRGEERLIYYCFFVEERSFAEIAELASEIFDVELEEAALRQRVARFRQRLLRQLAA